MPSADVVADFPDGDNIVLEEPISWAMWIGPEPTQTGPCTLSCWCAYIARRLSGQGEC